MISENLALNLHYFLKIKEKLALFVGKKKKKKRSDIPSIKDVLSVLKIQLHYSSVFPLEPINVPCIPAMVGTVPWMGC